MDTTSTKKKFYYLKTIQLFSMEVLELKMAAILRRTDKVEVVPTLDQYLAGQSTLDYKNQKFYFQGKGTNHHQRERIIAFIFERKKNIPGETKAPPHPPPPPQKTNFFRKRGSYFTAHIGVSPKNLWEEKIIFVFFFVWFF
ncbi:MAG: hypothetical protein IPI52_11935 [Bacteroidetes bacterium]|nr:hypothetical protein [Bacteroidota bacterium]